MSQTPEIRRLDTRRLDPDRPEDLDAAVALLRAGRLVAVPTETVYGLAADARSPEAVRGIFAAKGRPSNHPLIVHLPDASHLSRWAVDIPDAAWRLAEAFWPGPLTLLLPKAPDVPGEVTGGRPSIGLRVPAHPVMHALLVRLDGGLAAPSANPYQRLSPTSADQVLAGLSGRIDAVLDGGACEVGLESTIVDLTGCATGEPPRIVRAGPITRAQLEAALGMPVDFPGQHTVAVPGNVAVHYRPGTPLRMFDTATLRAQLDALPDDARIALAHTSDDLPASRGVIATLRLPADKPGFARALYATLHALDRAGADAIWLERPPEGEDWRDVHDRLSRAVSG
ncbi:L-threonylcarbamoyladenylate synthase [Lysobacter brunescens]|uniref:Threonylcarbamoyl-AMP synthase n=1 Tax=Lysobacter brunescens TaxID=262323 RepID=A0ABW2Y6A8_9GAMM